MPLRAIRKRCTGDNALSVAIAATTASHELAGLLAFPPARAASSILLAIFKTIQDVQSNKRECFRLAKRCVTLLSDVKAAMDGCEDDVPEVLLNNIAKFEKMLESLHADLQRDMEGKWHDRLLRKGTIETALVEYHARVDDAARSFQIVTLIHIHHAVGTRHVKVSSLPGKSTSSRSSDEWSTISSPAPPYSPEKEKESDGASIDTSAVSCLSTPSASMVSVASRSSTDSEYVLIPNKVRILSPSTSTASLLASSQWSIATGTDLESPTCMDHTEDEEDLSGEEQAFLAELALFDDRGFQRYDQRSIRPGRTKTKLSAGWWAGAEEVVVDGRSTLMVPYVASANTSGSRLRAAQRWLRDVKTLQNVYHPNLPELIGYSGIDAPTPFILLANVQTRLPQALLLSVLAHASLLDCIKLLIEYYKETLEAALYLQRQLSLSDSKTQDYVEYASFRISPYSEKKVVMGLPDPAAGVAEMESWRNFGLAWSIRDIWLAVLPNRGRVNRLVDLYDTADPAAQVKANHLALLARSLLPGNDAPTSALARLDDLARIIAPLPASPVDERDEMDDLLDLYDDDKEVGPPRVVERLTLRRLREVALRAGSHDVAWSNNFVPPHLFRVGDIGYILPEDSKARDGEDRPEALWSYGGFDRFATVCNVLDEVARADASECDAGISLQVLPDNQGWTTTFDRGRFEKTEIEPFDVGGGILGWPIVTSPGNRLTVHMLHCNYTVNVNDAWALLLERAPELALMHGVRPEDLMLVTRAGTEYRLKVHDIRSAPPSFGAVGHPAFPAHPSPFPPRPAFPGHGFPGQHHHIHGPPPPPPLPSYVFTTGYSGSTPCLQDSPVYLPHKMPQPQQRARCAWVSDGVYGFMNYVRLCAEDFD